MATEDKITLNITGIDSDGDNALDLSQPQRIYKVYETVSEAEADIASTDFSSIAESPLIVFVRDVAVHATIPAADFLKTEKYSIADSSKTIKSGIKGTDSSYTFSDASMAIGTEYTVTATLISDSSTRTFKIKAVGQALDDTDGHVGFFFTVDKNTPKLGDPVIVGGHTHINPQVLDQITDIDSTSLKTGEENVLVLVKKDPDSSDATASYDVKWLNRGDFENAFSDVGVPSGLESPVYLTATAKGLGWTNDFLPNTLFRRYSKTLTADDISNDGKTASYVYSDDDKEYRIDVEHDEILAFDGGTLVDNAAVAAIDKGFSVTATVSGTFEAGETVTFIAVRNGVSGILDAINEEYLTKADAVKLLSDGTVTLNDYALKDTLSEYALKVHYHGQYSLKGHNHDGRYAFYQHTHAQYMTKADMIKVLADSAESDESDANILATIEALAAEIKDEYDTLLGNLSSYVTSDQLEAALSSLKSTAGETIMSPLTDTDGYISINDAFRLLKAATDANTAALNNLTNVNDTAVKVTKTRIAYEKVGGIEINDEIKKGITLNDLLTKMFPTTKKTEPSVSAVYEEAAKIEVGQEVILNMKVSWTPGGTKDLESGVSSPNELTLATLDVYAGDSQIKKLSKAAGDFECSSGQDVTIEFQTESFAIGGDSVTISVKAGYGISSAVATAVYSLTIVPSRLAFAGSLAAEITSSTNIESEEFSDNIRSMFEFYSSDSIEFEIPASKNSRTLVVAIPDVWNKKINSVVYAGQNTDIYDLMAIRKGAKIEGDNNYQAISYTVYYYRFDELTNSDMIFDVALSDTEAS